MNFGVINERDCVNVQPPPDTRCNDPAFSLTNPSICSPQPQLIIKPGTAIACQFGSVEFKAFLVTNGVEQDVSADTIFTSSDLNVAMIGAVSGDATGVSAGECTITATYQDKTAQASFTVLAGDTCCDQITVAMLVLVDTTYSMAQSFDANYPSKLAYAQAAARRFISEVNYAKDMIGLSDFHGTSYDILGDIGTAKNALLAQVNLLQQTTDKTEFYDAVKNAVAQLNNTTADRKVLIVISDGLDTLTQTFTPSNDPIVLTDNFQQQGGTVICLGVRAAGEGFAFLSAMATGGFFINAYPSTEAASLDYLSGLKGYICAGQCTPAGDVIVGKGALNYSNFINWNVVGGYVDLQGNGFFDYLPGNGLYVDLISGTQPSGVENGMLKSKNTFALVSGDTYKLSVRLAGNQIKSRPDDAVHLQVFWVDGSNTNHVLLDQTVPVPDYTQPFQLYSFSFTPPVNCNAYITVQQSNAPTPSASDLSYRAGVLLDLVQLDDVTNLNNLLTDNFDAENQTYVPPACGQGTTWVWLPNLHHYGYAVGTACYGYGCLSGPPPVQSPDPNPQGDVESGATPPPTTYTSTKQACASCQNGTADLKWDLTPVSGSTSNGVPISPPANFDPPWCSNVFPAWVQFDFAAAVTVTAYLLYQCYGTHAADANHQPINVKLQGSNDGSTWTDLDTETGIQPLTDLIFPVASPAPYLHYRLYFTQYGDNTFICLTNALFNGVQPSQICATATATSQISQGDADSKATAAALAQAQAQLNCQPVYTSTQSYTAHCPPGTLGDPVTKTATATSYNSQAEADANALAAATAAANAALNCTQSNNNQAVTINDSNTPPTIATPYPSVDYVTGAPVSLSKVVVNLKAFSHTSPTDVLILLEGPDGTTCELMRHCGQTVVAVGPIDISFDDAAAAHLPNGSTFGAGTYKPSQYGLALAYPAPSPQPAYGATLSVFNGKNGNGSWALWVIDTVSFNAGQIANGWTLTLT